MAFDDTVKNKTEELGGKAKELAGKATGNEELEAQGNVDQASGKVKEAGNKLGEKLEAAKDAAGGVAEKVGATVKAAVDKLK